MAVMVMEPMDPDMQIALAEESGSPGSDYVWKHYDSNGFLKTNVLVLDIPADELRKSLEEFRMRHSTLLAPSPVALVDPSDKYVRIIAEYLERFSATDYEKAQNALWFVQSSMTYISDDDLYGRSEFWARPLETLYSHGGDCEDTSVLLCSIMLAMGLDAVLLNWDSHVAVGVCTDADGIFFEDGGKKYYMCETTRSDPGPIGQDPLWTEAPAVCHVQDAHVFQTCMEDFRQLIWRNFKF